MRRVVDRNTFR
ncbi:hypothetical protein ACHAXN_006834 [Cyclotella atomus]